MFKTLMYLVAALAMAQSALECSQCVSTVGWSDCMQNSTKENCTHFCYLLEELDSSIQTIRYKQGCTDDKKFCAEQSSEPNYFCSLCWEDKPLCITLSHRVTGIVDPEINDTIVPSKPSKDGQKATSSFVETIREQLSHGIQESKIWLQGLVGNVFDKSGKNEKTHARPENRANAIEATETSTERKEIPEKCSGTGNKTRSSPEINNTIAVAAPPETAAISGSSSLANVWITGSIFVMCFVILRV